MNAAPARAKARRRHQCAERIRRRDPRIHPPRRGASAPPARTKAEQAVNNIHSLLDRVSGSSVTEIDSLIADLHNVREFLKPKASACSARSRATRS